MTEEKMRRKKTSYDDSRQMFYLVERIHKFSEKRYPFLIGTIVYIIGFLIKRLAFNIKAITRENAGTRTYGLGLIIEAFFLQKIMIWILYLGHKFEISMLWDLVKGDKFTSDLFWKDLVLFWPDFAEIKKLDAEKIIPYLAQEVLPFAFGYIFLLACIIKFSDKLTIRFKGYRENSFDSGKSIFFKDEIGKKIGSLTITEDHLKTYVEPALIAILGLILWRFFDSAFGSFLIICVAASFYEDYQTHYKRWAVAQDVIDGEFEAKKLRARLDSRKERESQTSSTEQKKKKEPVAFATEYDFNKYKIEMKKTSNNGNAVKLN